MRIISRSLSPKTLIHTFVEKKTIIAMGTTLRCKHLVKCTTDRSKFMSIVQVKKKEKKFHLAKFSHVEMQRSIFSYMKFGDHHVL